MGILPETWTDGVGSWFSESNSLRKGWGNFLVELIIFPPETNSNSAFKPEKIRQNTPVIIDSNHPLIFGSKTPWILDPAVVSEG